MEPKAGISGVIGGCLTGEQNKTEEPRMGTYMGEPNA